MPPLQQERHLPLTPPSFCIILYTVEIEELLYKRRIDLAANNGPDCRAAITPQSRLRRGPDERRGLAKTDHRWAGHVEIL